MILWYIYVQPLPNIILYMALATMLWATLGWYFTKQWKRAKLWRAINALLLAAVIPAILYATLARTPTETREVLPIPLYSLIAAFGQVEHWRMMLMNILLFLPFGLTLSNALPKSMPLQKRFLNTLLGGLILSLLIEFLQFNFRLGTAQTDDLLFNTLGAAIGGFSLALRRYVKKIRSRLIELICEEIE